MNVQLLFSKEGIGIPYPPADRPDGSRNHGYFDIKKNPSLMDDIPELKHDPDLKALVKQINLETPYKTVGCDSWAIPAESPAPFNRKRGSYVELCFEDVARNASSDVFEEMCGTFKQFVADRPSKSVGMDFEIQRASFLDHNDLSGWAVAIFVYGYGATSLDAKVSWKRGVLALNDFFKSPPARLRSR